MNVALCFWSRNDVASLPQAVDMYAVVLNSGFAASSTFDGESFDQHGVAFWSAIPTAPDAIVGP